MSEPTTSSTEPTTAPVATPSPTAPPHHAEAPRRGGRLTAVAAWVGIVAGVVFIVAVIFFSGFVLGARGGHHGGGHHGHGDRGRDAAIFHRGGPPPMFPMGPRGDFDRRGPFGPGGPAFEPPQQPGGSTAPTPARP